MQTHLFSSFEMRSRNGEDYAQLIRWQVRERPGAGSIPLNCNPRVSPGTEVVCVCSGVCEVVCVNLGMTRSEISQAVFSVLSPVSVGA